MRLEREAVIVKQLTDHEQEVSERFEQQIVSQLIIYERLYNDAILEIQAPLILRL